jgi:bacterioferritin
MKALAKDKDVLIPTEAKELSSVPTLLLDKDALRKLARKNLEEGAVTLDYGLDKDTVVDLLNQALATEIV